MHIYNIKEVDLSEKEFKHLSFNDATATAAEIEAILNQVEVCHALTIYTNNLSELTGSLQHIQALQSINFNLPYVQNIPDDYFPQELITCRFSCERLTQLPKSLLSNKNLQHLTLRLAATTLPNQTFSHLKDLNLNMPKLKELPDSFLTPKLLRISIQNSQLLQLPNTLSTCTALTFININAPLQAEMPDLSGLSNLTGLFLINVEMEFFSRKYELPTNLQTLHISSKFPINNVPSLTKLSKITRLHLGAIASLPSGLDNCKNLQYLYIQSLLDAKIPDLSACKNLYFLSIQNVNLTEIPAFVFNLSRLKNLVIQKTKIRKIPNNWQNNTALEILDLRNNGIQINDLSFTNQLPKLKTLSLEGNTLLDPYALISNKKIPLADQQRLLTNVRYHANISRNRRPKEPSFLDFCAALGRTTLPMSDKKWFFDLIANYAYLAQAPALDFPQFLKGLNINFKPLRTLLERKLIRDVLIQHLSDTAIFQNPFAFDPPPNLKKGDCLLLAGKMILPKAEMKEIAENLGLKTTFRLSQEVTHVVLGQDAENWKEDSKATGFQIITESSLRSYFTKNAPKFLEEDEQFGDLSMVKNVMELLENGEEQNISLALELMAGGGVPKMALEELLIQAKTSPNALIRKKAKELLILNAPKKWLPLIKNRLEFHSENLWFALKEMRKKMLNLSSQIAPELTAFFIVLLQQRLSVYPEMVNELDEILYEMSKKMDIEDKLLQPGAVVFVNGTTRLKKTEIKAKLEAANLKYAQKYSAKVTHVLIGNNPKTWDLDKANFKILTENHLQTYLSKITPSYLEEAAEEGDTQMSDNVLQMLHSPDESNVAIALEMLEGGGVPTDLLVPVLVISKSASDAKIRAKARKLLELYAPADWLPLIKNKLLFKGITANAKENDLNKKLDKLTKETSFDLAAMLSMGLFKKYKRGLRFMMKKSNRKEYLSAAKLLLKGTHLAFAEGLGFKNWRNHAPDAVILMGAMKTGINFPATLLELGKIESIDFHNCKLSSMPKDTTKFKDVKELDFSHNFIKTLPQGLHKLEKLEVLNLKMNHFDKFPVRLATVKTLKKVDLSFNRANHEFTKLEVPQEIKEALPNCEFIV
jgi:Leucine-rich repeat (LRR) protein/BRCT domain type II-containing protein